MSPLMVVAEPGDCWQSHLLGSELLTTLPVTVWQRLLSRLNPTVVAGGTRVVREGEKVAGRCFILAAGQANVFQGRRIVNRLGPGGYVW